MLTKEDCIAAMLEYKHLKQNAKEIEDRCDALRNKIIRYMDSAGRERISCEDATAVRYSQYQKRVDVKRLELDHLELVADYKYEKKVDFLKVL
jgi:hypothetical protein